MATGRTWPQTLFFCCRRVSTQASTRHSLLSRNPCETQRQLTERWRKRRKNRTRMDSRESNPKIKKRIDSSSHHPKVGAMGTDPEKQLKHFQRRGNAMKTRNRTDNEQGRTRTENEATMEEKIIREGPQVDEERRRGNEQHRKVTIEAHCTETQPPKPRRDANLMTRNQPIQTASQVQSGSENPSASEAPSYKQQDFFFKAKLTDRRECDTEGTERTDR